MKKWMPALLCLALLVCTIPTAVLAEPGNTTTTTTTTESTTTTSSTDTTTSPYSDLGFLFEYSYNYESITVTWNAGNAAGLTVDGVQIGSNIKPVGDSSGEFIVDISDLNPGTYSMTYKMSDGEAVASGERVERGGVLNTHITLTVVNGRIAATVLDEYGRAVADCPLYLSIANTIIDTDPKYTDENGKVFFPVSPPADRSQVLCKAETFSKDLTKVSIQYNGSESGFSGTPTSASTAAPSSTKPGTTASTTRTGTKTRTTDSDETTIATTIATYPIVSGAGTTAIVGDQIAVNVSFDTQVAKNFNYSNGDFAARARFLLSKELYTNIIGDTTATLMLQAKTSSLVISDQHISTAISGKSKYSLYHAEDTLRIPLDLSLYFIDTAHDASTPVAMPVSEVTVELPIPQSMKSTSKYTIAAAICDENGIAQLLNTTVEDGTIQFKTNQMSSVVILGFEKPEGLSANSGGIPFLVIGMITLGILMLGGAGTLLYFFFLRKPIEETGAPFAMGNTDSNDSATSFNPLGDASGNIRPHTFNNNIEEPPVPGVSLGSLLNRQEQNDQPTKKNPSDYDVDL